MNGIRGWDAKLRLQKKLMAIKAAEMNQIIAEEIYADAYKRDQWAANYLDEQGRDTGLQKVSVEILWQVLVKNKGIRDIHVNMHDGRTMRLALE